MTKPHTDPASLALQAQQFLQQGRPDLALEPARNLLKARPDDEETLVLLANAEMQTGRQADARARLERVTRTGRPNPRLLRTLGSALQLEGRLDEASQTFARALELDPDDDVTRCAAADNRVLAGNAEEALALLTPIIDGARWTVNAAVIHASVCSSLDRHSAALDPLDRALARPDLTQAGRIELLYRLGACRDRLGAFDDAFDAYDEANRLQTVRHDPDANARAMEEARQHWTRDEIARLRREQPGSERAVLIVGMPRSGTSLVEQIVSSHPDVHGADERAFLTQLASELDPPAPGQLPMVRSPDRVRSQTVARSARKYLKLLDDLAEGETRVTDKMPVNFLHLGLVGAMLPQARVIHCVRDPLDTCLSCYFQGFNRGLSFAFHLDHLGRFYRAYEGLMDHWREVLDLPMLEVRYESMVDDQPGEARRLIEFLGLPWDDRCLRFYDAERSQMTSSNQQVRRPIYRSSVARHKHYESHLGALQAALGEHA